MKQICNAIIFAINPFHYEILHSGFKGSRSISDAKNLRKSDQVIAVCKIFSVSFSPPQKKNLYSIWIREGMLHSDGLFLFVFYWQFSWFWHLLSTYYVPGTVLDGGDMKRSKTWSLFPRSLQSLGGKPVVQRQSLF